MVQKHKKEKAFAMRLEGKSYGEIMKALDLPSKGTLSGWFRKIKLTPEARRKLRKNTLIAWKQKFFKFNKERTERINSENKMITSEAAKSVPKLSRRDLLLIGSALYWGEGTTREYKYNQMHRIAFSNSNPDMIRIFMKYLREVLNVNDQKIHPEIQLHPNIGENKAKAFWSNITNLPQSKFYTYRPVNKSSKFIRPKHFLPYGTLNLRVYKRQLFYRVRGYIQGIINQF